MKKPVNPLSLRSSGHLLVGLTRIFQKKVSYLFEDTTQAFHRLTNKSTKSAHLELNETEAAPAGNINMVLGGSDFDIPALGSVDVLRCVFVVCDTHTCLNCPPSLFFFAPLGS